jgi:hypothetical protein
LPAKIRIESFLKYCAEVFDVDGGGMLDYCKQKAVIYG